MSKKFGFILKTTSALLGASLLMADPAQALPKLETEIQDSGILEQIKLNNNSNSLSQVTNVSELRDVSPNEWAYEALRSLVERYGCLVGYPDGTFRGGRALTRWEFAAGLNACLNSIERLIQENAAVSQTDLDKLKRLAQEFEAELAAPGGRVDNLEGRVAFLEDHQFSTTTKLTGEVVIGLAGVAAGEGAEGEEIDEVPVLGYRARLELNTSYTGDDLLFARLSGGNFPDFAGEGSNQIFEGNLSFSQPQDNDFALEVLYYLFPVTESTQIYIAVDGGAADDFAPTLNVLDGDGGSGAISLFGTRNPIYLSPGDAGLAIIQEIGEVFELEAGYLADPANESSEGSGLFNGPYTAIAQLTYKPSERFNVAFTYAHNYKQSDTGTGTQRANFSFFTDEILGIGEVPTSSNSYAVAVSWQIAENFVLGGWGTYTNTQTLSSLDGQLERGSLDIWNWAVTLAFPDLIKEGSVAGIIVGMEPWVADSTIEIPGRRDSDRDPALHLEGFFQLQLTDYLSITPGLVWITSPNGDSDNDDLVIGTIRTTFTF